MNWIEILANIENIICKIVTGIVISRWLDKKFGENE